MQGWIKVIEDPKTTTTIALKTGREKYFKKMTLK